MQKSANYGMDAPIVIRNLSLAVFGSLIALFMTLGISKLIWFWAIFSLTLLISLSLGLSILWMLYSMWILKPNILKQSLNDFDLKGNETILDMGCGRGLFLNTIAKKLKRGGKAYGVDLWSKDQSGNQPLTTLENAKLEGVLDRVELTTGDMRYLPYSDQSFDLIVSSLAIHNIADQTEREKVLSEMLRVLKPGGYFYVLDFHYTQQYLDFLQKKEGIELNSPTFFYGYCPPLHAIQGKKIS